MASKSSVFLSVISPVYRGEKLVHSLLDRLRAALKASTDNFEIILVEDASPDASWAAIVESCQEDPRVIGVRLSRNFGQHYAISAGLQLARGEWIVVMDCDLQDRPEEIPRLLQVARGGSDVVWARRTKRQDTFFKRAMSRIFYRAMTYLTGTQHDPAIANFGVYHRRVVNAVNSMPESIRYFPTMIRWVGFTTTTLEVAHAARPEGDSSYKFRQLVRLATDIILANSDKPLKLVVKTGFAISALGLGFAGYTIIQALRGKIAVLGYASLLVSIWVLAGLTIFIIGIVALYVGKIFEGVKQRPAFIIRDIVNRPDECTSGVFRSSGDILT